MTATSPPVVLLDGRSLADDSSYRGIGTYVRHLVEGLAARDDVALAVLAMPGTTVPARARAVPMRRLLTNKWAAAEHELRLPFDIRRAPADVFHSPALTPPRRCARPWVQSVHDVMPLELDDDAYAAQRRRWERSRDRYRRAAAIIANSEHTADSVRRHLRIDGERISVVRLGVSSAFRPPAVRPVAEPPYLLLVAEYAPHKGHREAFEIIGGLAERGLPHRLKVAGRVAPWVEAQLKSLVAAAPQPDRIDTLGFVPDIVSLYQGASAVIVTSHYEGFGLPAVEAMATATPVVAFATTATTETVGDGGTLVPDGDVRSFVDSVAALLESKERWNEASARALRRSAAFDWDTCVDRHAEIYRSVACG